MTTSTCSRARRRAGPAVAAVLLFTGGAAAQTPFRATFDFVLSDFTGPVRVGDVRLAADPASGEIAVTRGREIHVFNREGMEAFLFRTPRELGAVVDLAIETDGGFLTLAYDLAAPGDRPRFVLLRHSFRGEKAGQMELSGLPPNFAGILPDRVIGHPEGLLVASTGQLLAVLVERDGTFVRGLDLAAILEIDPADRDTQEITGLTVDAQGNLLLTCATMFRAFVVSPQGRLLASWGEPGSAPGDFGVVAGIARDSQGRTFVADKIRGVVMVFDPAFRLLSEIVGAPAPHGVFGTPTGVYTDDSGKLYVTQVGKRGVWAFDVSPK